MQYPAPVCLVLSPCPGAAPSVVFGGRSGVGSELGVLQSRETSLTEHSQLTGTVTFTDAKRAEEDA